MEALPEVRVELVDIDPKMLEVAATRCARHAERFRVRHARFQGELPRCHAVVASLALHHVATLAAKRELYRAIYDTLEPGGVVVVADALTYPDADVFWRDGEIAVYGAFKGD